MNSQDREPIFADVDGGLIGPKRLLQDAQAECVAVVDVRERREYDSGRIVGSGLCTRGDLEWRIGTLVPALGMPVALFSAGDERALLARLTLQDTGFRDVGVLDCSLDMAEAAGLSLTAGPNVLGKTFGERMLQKSHMERVSPEELQIQLLADDPPLVVDCRTVEEFGRSHIPGAISLPKAQVPEAISELRELDRPVVTYCAGRTRGILGANLLTDGGVEDVAWLEDGLAAWRESGFLLEYGWESSSAPVTTRGYSGAPRSDKVPHHTEDDPIANWLNALEGGNRPYLVDMRPESEISKTSPRIPGAVSLDFTQLQFVAEESLPVQCHEVLIVDHSVVRASAAVAELKGLGYLNVRSAPGLIREYAADPEGVDRAISPVCGNSVMAADVLDPDSALSVDEVRIRDREHLFIVDTRPSGEFVMGHIRGSYNIPRGLLEIWWPRLPSMRRGTTIVIVDEQALRASLARKTVSALAGGCATFCLSGGLASWRAQHLPLEEGFDGCFVEKSEAKADVEMHSRQGVLRVTARDMHDYLAWERALA